MGDFLSGASDLISAPFNIGLGIVNTIRGFKQDEQQQNNFEWQKEQYINQRDYERALQKEIFAREDTAVQRALDDYTNAGFSPLAAIGQNYDAGQAVSSSVAPSGAVSNFGGQALSEAYAQSGAIFSQLLQGAQTLKQIGEQHKADMIADQAVHELEMERVQQEHLNRSAEIAQSATSQQELARLQSQLADDAREDSQAHDKDMATINHNNAVAQMEATYDKHIDSMSAMTDPNARVARNLTVKDLLNSDDELLRSYGNFLTTNPAIRDNPEEQARYIQLMIDQVAANNANAQRNIDNFSNLTGSLSGAASAAGSFSSTTATGGFLGAPLGR